MKIITRQIIANEAACTAGVWKNYGDNRKSVYDKLKDLGDTPDPDMVDKIIGNSSWTDVGECEECKEISETLIQLGEDTDYESHTARICPSCLKKAKKLLKEIS